MQHEFRMLVRHTTSCLSVRQKSGPLPTIALTLAKMDVFVSTS